MKRLIKQKSTAFGKDVYLLGKNEHGESLWLEAPSWDCGWYWGFGYIEVYTGRGGRGSSHFESLVGFVNSNGGYVHHLNESPKMKATVLTESESWELCDLMKSFYTLRETAHISRNGHSNLAGFNSVDLRAPKIARHINQTAIPAITARVIEILNP